MAQSVRQLLDDCETDIVDRIANLRAQIVPLERELADVRRAKQALSRDVETQFQLPVTGLDAAKLSIDHYRRNRNLAAHGLPSPYAKLTMKQLVCKALREQFREGATANELLDFFTNAWGRTDVIRTSLSPQLSRLKREDTIALHGLVWTLKSLPEQALSENEPPNGKPEGGSETALAAQ